MIELITAMVLACLIHWTMLWGHIPVFTNLYRWFWQFTDNPAGGVWFVLPLVLLAIAIAALVTSARVSAKRKLILLIAAGFVMQLGFAATEGRGIDAMRDGITTSGHATFATQAVHQSNAWHVVKNYDDMASAGHLGKYANSKPPGQFLLYVGTERIANLTNRQADAEDRLARLRTFASLLWPAISYLVLVPMFLLAKIIMDERRAIFACALYLVVPSACLVTLHTDQVFFPAFGVMTLFLLVKACKKQSALLFAATGAAFYLIVFCSFGLLAMLPLAATVCIPFFVTRPFGRSQLMSIAKCALALVAGLLLTAILFKALFGYDVLVRYQHAMAHHVAWKGWDGKVRTVIYCAFIDSIEYILWLGLPLALLLLCNWVRSATQTAKGCLSAHFCLSIGLLAVFVALAFFGKTKGETARLWLFLVPYICLLVSDEIYARFRPRWRAWIVFLVIGLQFVTVYLTKLHQDFH